MAWAREAEFKNLLSKCSQHLSRSAIDSIVRIAIEDHNQCYKAVPALMEKQLRKSSGSQAVNVLYAGSKLLRQARKELKGKSKYADRFAPLLPGMFATLSAQRLSTSEQQGIIKLLVSWRTESILPAQLIGACEALMTSLTTPAGPDMLGPGGAGDAAEGSDTAGHTQQQLLPQLDEPAAVGSKASAAAPLSPAKPAALTPAKRSADALDGGEANSRPPPALLEALSAAAAAIAAVKADGAGAAAKLPAPAVATASKHVALAVDREGSNDSYDPFSADSAGDNLRQHASAPPPPPAASPPPPPPPVPAANLEGIAAAGSKGMAGTATGGSNGGAAALAGLPVDPRARVSSASHAAVNGVQQPLAQQLFKPLVPQLQLQQAAGGAVPPPPPAYATAAGTNANQVPSFAATNGLALNDFMQPWQLACGLSQQPQQQQRQQPPHLQQLCWAGHNAHNSSMEHLPWQQQQQLPQLPALPQAQLPQPPPMQQPNIATSWQQQQRPLQYQQPSIVAGVQPGSSIGVLPSLRAHAPTPPRPMAPGLSRQQHSSSTSVAEVGRTSRLSFGHNVRTRPPVPSPAAPPQAGGAASDRRSTAAQHMAAPTGGGVATSLPAWKGPLPPGLGPIAAMSVVRHGSGPAAAQPLPPGLLPDALVAAAAAPPPPPTADAALENGVNTAVMVPDGGANAVPIKPHRKSRWESVEAATDRGAEEAAAIEVEGMAAGDQHAPTALGGLVADTKQQAHHALATSSKQAEASSQAEAQAQALLQAAGALPAEAALQRDAGAAHPPSLPTATGKLAETSKGGTYGHATHAAPGVQQSLQQSYVGNMVAHSPPTSTAKHTPTITIAFASSVTEHASSGSRRKEPDQHDEDVMRDLALDNIVDL